MKVVLRLAGGILYPATDDTADHLNKMDGHFSVDIKKARSPGYPRYAMMTLREMWSMVDTTMGFEPFRKLLTVKAGYFTSVGKVDIAGTTSLAVIPDSLAFEHMDEDEFRDCWSNIHQAFSEKFGRELSDDQLTAWSRM